MIIQKLFDKTGKITDNNHMKNLSSQQIQVAINALYLAIEQYSALSMQSLAAGNVRIYEQFKRQEKESKELLAELE